MEKINIYVAENGNDLFDGSAKKPFRTPERAIEKVKEIRTSDKDAKITVNIGKGEYRTGSLKLDSSFSYVEFKGDNAVLNGGATVDSKLFRPVSGKDAEMFSADARKHILAADLKDAGITPEALGKLYAFGRVNTADRYDGDTVGTNAEIFFNGNRMTLARYPNEGFKIIEEVTDEGIHGGMQEYSNCRNPRGGTMVVDDEVNARIKGWKEPEKMWIFGYFYWDWADSSTPVDSVDTETKEIKMRYTSHYGLRKNTEYYIYNVPEELDCPGEYYIDRDSMRLYIYPPEEDKDFTVEVSLSKEPILETKNTNNFVLDGITFTGTKDDGVHIEGNNCVIGNCTVKNVAKWGITVFGENNRIFSNEVFATGQGGIRFYGGNTAKLTHGNCIAEYNYVHDYSAVDKTGGSGIETGGCGNTIAHNEIENAPQMALWYGGAEHTVEYNKIKRVCQQSNDTGAIYNGRDWAAYGSVIRYNLFEDIGNEHYHPVVIYWDDTLCGQTAYGNIIKNSSAKGFLVGGGKDNVIANNIIIYCEEYSILFDRRGRDWKAGWLEHDKPYSLWARMQGICPDKSPWKDKYPILQQLHVDESRADDALYAANPSRAVIKNNVMVYDGTSDVCRGIHGCLIEPDVIRLGEVRDNLVFKFENECLKDGTFELKDDVAAQIPGFERIPFEKIGRK